MTAKIKLNAASGGGSFSLQAPSSSSNTRVLTLPDSADGIIAKTSDVAFVSYAIIADQKSSGIAGGTFTSGSFQQRDLNIVLYDPDSIVSISSNDFTLQAGSYFVRASAPAFAVNLHMCLLRNHTDSTNIQTGSSEFSSDQGYANNRSFVSARFTITAAKALRITHKCQSTKSSNGFGAASGFTTETFTIVEIFKEL
jgi:hypothetical protein